MKTAIKIDSYADGYGFNEMHCVDQAIAVASGAFHYDLFYYYSFYYSFYSNWHNNGKFLNRPHIFEKLGMQFNSINITNETELIQAIKQALDQHQPVLLPVKYNAIYFHPSYMDKSPELVNHAPLVLFGYNSDNSTIQLKLVRSDLDMKRRTFVSLDYQMTEQMIKDIWIASNEQFKQQNDEERYNALYTLEQSTKEPAQIARRMAYDLTTIGEKGASNLGVIIQRFNEMDKGYSHLHDLSAKTLLFYTHAGLHIFFDSIERLQPIHELDKHDQQTYESFKAHYIAERSLILGRLCTYIAKNKSLSSSEQLQLLDQIEAMDQELAAMFKRWFIEPAGNQSRIQAEAVPVRALVSSVAIPKSEQAPLINYALTAAATADSQASPASSPTCAIDGNPDDHPWHSKGTDEPKWLCLDLGQPRSITKIVLKHCEKKLLKRTHDFEIQASMDGSSWGTIAEVKENTLSETVQVLDSPLAYRYFRVFITKENLKDKGALIYQFELWGPGGQ